MQVDNKTFVQSQRPEELQHVEVDRIAAENNQTALGVQKTINQKCSLVRSNRKGKLTKLSPVQQTFCSVHELLPKIEVQLSPTRPVTPLRLRPSSPVSSESVVLVG